MHKMRASDLMALAALCLLAAAAAAAAGVGAAVGKQDKGVKDEGRKGHAKLDPLLRARCDLRCWDVAKPNRTECRSACRESLTKPGSCPSSGDGGDGHDRWAGTCVTACSSDVHCDGTARCCSQPCGAVCLEPTDLLSLPGLPAIPVLADVTERRRASVVRWASAVGDSARGVPGRVLHVLEAQHHLGPDYEQSRLGAWAPLARALKTQASLKGVLKPGRWYRFRVAAVSADGTRGYSAPSAPFTPRRGPRPPAAPRRPRVTRLLARRGNLTAVLQWRAPASDVPLARYKVFWSRRVRGIDGALDSVLVNHQLVPHDQTFAEIPNLQPNSMYFLQVQAIAQFGQTKLRSEKAATFFNTTNYENDTTTFVEDRTRSSGGGGGGGGGGTRYKITGMKMHKILWHNNKLKARVSWDPLPDFKGKPRRYMIQWWTGTCEGENNDHKARKQLAATTQANSFELYELAYGCKYRVYLNRLPARARAAPEAALTFHVPSCSHFQSRLNGSDVCSATSPPSPAAAATAPHKPAATN